jgi:hypothetical protein
VASATARSQASTATSLAPCNPRTSPPSTAAPTVAGNAYAATASPVHTPACPAGAICTASQATATMLIPSPTAEISIPGKIRRSTGWPNTRPKDPRCDDTIADRGTGSGTGDTSLPTPGILSTAVRSRPWPPVSATTARSRRPRHDDAAGGWSMRTRTTRQREGGLRRRSATSGVCRHRRLSRTTGYSRSVLRWYFA